jgi:2,3-bisphosphoglycerate-dependent phosphoglycerate mutase
MKLEHLSPEEVTKLELATGVPVVYGLNASGQITHKVILNE